jgi:hypothetical protein
MTAEKAEQTHVPIIYLSAKLGNAHSAKIRRGDDQEGGGQDKADFSSPQKCLYVFVCASFFREIVCLGLGATERLSGLFDARNCRFAPLARETL